MASSRIFSTLAILILAISLPVGGWRSRHGHLFVQGDYGAAGPYGATMPFAVCGNSWLRLDFMSNSLKERKEDWRRFPAHMHMGAHWPLEYRA